MDGRFVVLEHRWEGVHYDILLESVGRLLTWAVDRPIVEGCDLPARPLPPHRLIYLDYEGQISGDRGEVRRLDRGTYLVQIWTDRRIVVDLRGERWTGPAEFLATGPDAGQETSGSPWRFRLGKVD